VAWGKDLHHLIDTLFFYKQHLDDFLGCGQRTSPLGYPSLVLEMAQ
jgi:hypothetical protein